MVVAAGVVEHAPGQCRAALAHAEDEAAGLAGLGRRDIPPVDRFGAEDDTLQHVVDVVGDAGGKLAEGGDLLGLAQPCLEFGAGAGGGGALLRAGGALGQRGALDVEPALHAAGQQQQQQHGDQGGERERGGLVQPGRADGCGVDAEGDDQGVVGDATHRQQVEAADQRAALYHHGGFAGPGRAGGPHHRVVGGEALAGGGDPDRGARQHRTVLAGQDQAGGGGCGDGGEQALEVAGREGGGEHAAIGQPVRPVAGAGDMHHQPAGGMADHQFADEAVRGGDGRGRFSTRSTENREYPEHGPQLPQPQHVKHTTWDLRRSASGVLPERCRRRGRNVAGGRAGRGNGSEATATGYASSRRCSVSGNNDQEQGRLAPAAVENGVGDIGAVAWPSRRERVLRCRQPTRCEPALSAR